MNMRLCNIAKSNKFQVVGSGCATVGVAGAGVGIGLVFGMFITKGPLQDVQRFCTVVAGLVDEGNNCSQPTLVVTTDHAGYNVVDRLLMFFRSQFQFRIVSLNCRVHEVHLIARVYNQHDRTKLSRSLTVLKGGAGFGILIDTFGVDLVGLDKETLYGIKEKKLRYEVVYQFASFKTNIRVFVHALLGPKIQSLISGVADFEGMNWVEREIYDMFGILFTNHPNLRRILTDYGFQGFPLRKDFPVSGYSELRFDKEAQSLVYDRVSLQQKGRLFEYPVSEHV
jgi:NADH:ubiquinone oxidoreductase subunit C